MMPHIMLRIILLFATLAATVPAAAVTLTEGVEYERLAAPEPTRDPKKIEVLEVFSYGCVHCFHLEPALRAWKAKLPGDVDLEYLPATIRPEFQLYARGFYAAEALGQLQATHARVFDALWNDGRQIHSLGDLANLYASLGVDRARFIEAAQSAENRAAVDAAYAKVRRLKVDGTPIIYVAGRYRVLANLISNQEELLQRVDALIEMERAARARRH
jgi:protein dithiol oxidoreductase (disulfide-forming)